MKHVIASLLAIGLSTAVFIPIHALADADDAAWIKKCVSDNSDQKQTPETVAVYCSCMNEKMSSAETLSITAWEKKHPAEQEACSKQAKWKSQ